MFLKLLSVLQHSFLPLVWREAVVNFSLLIPKATLNNGRDKYVYASVSTHLFKIFCRMIDSLNVIPREKSYIPSDSDNICLSFELIIFGMRLRRISQCGIYQYFAS